MLTTSWKDIANSNECTPESMMKIVAKMIKRGMVSIEEIWPHLSPVDKDIESDYEFKMNIAYKIFQENYVKKL